MIPSVPVMRFTLVAAVTAALVAAPGDVSAQHAPLAPVELTRRAYADGALILRRGPTGDGVIVRIDASGGEHTVPCERLEGAWGLWLDDVDGDGRADVLVALRKRARFDPALENRLHVYAIDADSCVPMWRGTRLAGRFDALALEPGAPGVVVAWERVGAGLRRVARYRWVSFGYALDRVLWSGSGASPAALRRLADRQGVAP